MVHPATGTFCADSLASPVPRDASGYPAAVADERVLLRVLMALRAVRDLFDC